MVLSFDDLGCFGQAHAGLEGPTGGFKYKCFEDEAYTQCALFLSPDETNNFFSAIKAVRCVS